jgi:hypothetical protein
MSVKHDDDYGVPPPFRRGKERKKVAHLGRNIVALGPSRKKPAPGQKKAPDCVTVDSADKLDIRFLPQAKHGRRRKGSGGSFSDVSGRPADDPSTAARDPLRTWWLCKKQTGLPAIVRFGMARCASLVQ